VIEIDLIPPEINKLGRPEPVAEGQEDHGRVPVAGRSLDHALDLGLRQMLPGASSALGRRNGVTTVGFLPVGATSLRCEFPM